MRAARILGFVGKTFIWVGTLILLFVAYQLWGTGLAEARAQGDLEDRFTELLDEAPDDPGGPVEEDPTVDDGAATTVAFPEVLDGDPVARIVIPKIGVDKVVVQGVTRDDLKKGPGHYVGTPFPGQAGNAAIAGHRTTYGAPFHRVDELVPGDEIEVETVQGTFTYVVQETTIVRPSDVEVIADKGDNRLTLTSCHPKYSARERIIVSALLEEAPAPTPPTTAPVTEVTELDSIDGDARGSWTPVITWGALLAAIWLAFYAISRRWRRWPAYLLGAVPFGVVLFIWYGAIVELLPSNI